VICVPALPQGMPVGEDGRYAEDIRAVGFFCKVWGYRVPKATGEVARQLAPLLVGPAPVWYPAPERKSNLVAQGVAAGLFVLALLAIWVFMWRSGRRDARLRREFRGE
jgi:hypothetical protein